MANAQQHEWQAKRNCRFLSEIENTEFNCAYNEWKITVLFYAALHRLQTLFANNTKSLPRHPGKHVLILETINKHEMFKPIRKPYITLFNLCHDARYECTAMSGEDLKVAKEYFEELLKQIEKLAS